MLLLAHVNRDITGTVLSAQILTNVKIRLATKMRFVKIRMVMLNANAFLGIKETVSNVLMSMNVHKCHMTVMFSLLNVKTLLDPLIANVETAGHSE